MISDVVLGDLCSLIVDSEHKTAPKDPDGLYPLIRTTDLARARADLSSAQMVNGETHALWTKRAVPTVGDLILAREAPVGGICRVSDGVEPVLGQRTVLLRPDPNLVDGRFLMYRLASDDLQARMAEMSTGSTVPHLNMADIRTFPVSPLPPFSAQRRIGAVLAAFDELIEINERRIELLEDLARSLYREWFVHFRFPGHENAEFVELDGRPLPAEWRAGELGEIADLNGKKVKASDIHDPFQYLDISSVGVGKLEVPIIMQAVEAPGRARRRASDGDVVWATVRPNRRSHALIHDPPPDLVVSTGLAVLTPVAVPSSFLFEYAASDEFSSYLVGRASGAAYPAVRPNDFKSAPVLLPPQSLLERFDEMVDPMLRLASVLRRRNWQFAATRDLLLPRLVTGQLDISDLDLGVLTPAETE